MTLATALSRAQQGIDAPLVNVEVHLSNGLPRMSIVGLPETAVKESKDRVRAALLNSNFKFPTRIITVSLAPADLPKDGGRFDLSIALGILAASGQIPKDGLAEYEFIGELALNGELRPVRGVLPAALKAAAESRALVVPRDNGAEGALAQGVKIFPADHLLQICAHLRGAKTIEPLSPVRHAASSAETPDMADVRGQQRAKRALEVAAAGGHNMLMIGPPGTGKTMLASRLPGILPPMTETESLEAAAISSIGGQGFHVESWGRRPFRAPHHTASGVALVGGGSNPRPGEISLAHNGVLFLDELTEFDRRVLEVLREPLETGRITISRAARQAEFPAQFQFIAAMNPCPQGYDCDLRTNCRCTPEQQRKYRSRISAPLLDRIDLHVDAPRVPRAMLRSENSGESSAEIRARVTESRQRQLRRQGKINALMSNRDVDRYCRLADDANALFDQAISRFKLSARAYHRILKVARTIADIAGSDDVGQNHLTEAISYRSLDWFNARDGGLIASG